MWTESKTFWTVGEVMDEDETLKQYQAYIYLCYQPNYLTLLGNTVKSGGIFQVFFWVNNKKYFVIKYKINYYKFTF